MTVNILKAREPLLRDFNVHFNLISVTSDRLVNGFCVG
jgi:hypothetical protein